MTSAELCKKAKAELARRELARRHLLDFVHYNFPGYRANWHHKVLIDRLEKVERGEIKRLMVFMPPRHGKSELVSVQFPAWAIGRDADRHIIQASYNADLATDFGRQTRNLIAGKEFRNAFPSVSLSEDSTAKGKWNTNGRGAYNAVGVGGSTTGKGADFLIIDDPLKNRKDADSAVIRQAQWDWYRSTARTRLSPNGAIILVLTRWHDDDLAGKILASDNASKWEIVKFPAIATHDEGYRKEGEALWPGQYGIDNLMETKADIGSYEWSALYQQEPLDEENQEFKKQWFKEISWEEVERMNTNRFLTIDPAFSQRDSADWIGITRNFVNRENKWHVKSYHVRLNTKELIDLLFTLHKEDNYTAIGIEKGAYKDAIQPFLEEEMRKRNVFFAVEPLDHSQISKETRIRGLIPRYESGSVYHIKGWCQDLEEELLRFPKAVHDDTMDSLAYQNRIAYAPYARTMEEQVDDLHAEERNTTNYAR